jgi:ribosomal protein L7Ae-like RNA K-turn-binding protein
VDEALTGLVKQIEAVVEANQKKTKLCSFVVVITDDVEENAKKLAAIKADHGVDYVPLTTT